MKKFIAVFITVLFIVSTHYYGKEVDKIPHIQLDGVDRYYSPSFVLFEDDVLIPVFEVLNDLGYDNEQIKYNKGLNSISTGTYSYVLENRDGYYYDRLFVSIDFFKKAGCNVYWMPSDRKLVIESDNLDFFRSSEIKQVDIEKAYDLLAESKNADFKILLKDKVLSGDNYQITGPERIKNFSVKCEDRINTDLFLYKDSYTIKVTSNVGAYDIKGSLGTVGEEVNIFINVKISSEKKGISLNLRINNMSKRDVQIKVLNDDYSNVNVFSKDNTLITPSNPEDGIYIIKVYNELLRG